MFGAFNYGYATVHWQDGDYITNSTQISNDDIIIYGTTFISSNAIVEVDNSAFKFYSGAKIIVTDNAQLHIEGCNLQADQSNLYEGIILVDQSYLELVGSEISGAISAVNSTELSDFYIVDNDFVDNEISLEVENVTNDHQGVFHSNTIYYTGSILPPGSLSNIIGIKITNVKPTTPNYKLTIGDNSNSSYVNIIEDCPTGSTPIYTYKSDVKFINANISQHNANNGIEIAGSNTLSDISNVYVHSVDIQNNNQTSDYCITVENYANTNILECNFNDANEANVYYYNNTGDAIIENSVFNSDNVSKAGLYAKNTSSITASTINNCTFNYDDMNGMKLETSVGYEITDCDFITSNPSMSGTGIYAISSTDNVFINASTFEMGDNGIGVYCTNNSSNIQISTNEFYSSSEGIGIQIKEDCNDINIVDANNFYFDNDDLGIGIYINNSNSIDVIGNNIGTSGNLQKVEWGIKSVNSSNIEIVDNNIFLDLKNAIYSSHDEDIYITDNIIEFSSATSSRKIGISVNYPEVNNFNRNNISDNNIDITNYVSLAPQAYEGIFAENCPNTNIISNTISGAGYAMHLKSDNSNGKVACNEFLDSHEGIHLEDAIWGEFNGSFFLIGMISKPPTTMDNYWNNIGDSDGRVKGNISGIYNQVYYYNNQSGYELYNSMYNVAPLGSGASFSSTLKSNSQSYCGSKSSYITNSKIGNNPAEDRETLVAYAIDTLSIMQNNITSLNNPQGIYTSELRYASVKNAYYNYKRNPQFQNLGLASDQLFNNFEYKLNNSNIHYNYLADMFIKKNKYNQALNQISNIQANSLGEINTINAYNKLIQYYKTDSLSSADSSLLSGIAYQNPSVGGQSVYIARNLLGLYIIDTNNTFNSSYSMANNLTSLQNDNKNNLIEVMPNPAKNSLNINLSLENEGASDIKIYSIEGRIVYKNSFNNYSFNTIDISNLEKGAYFIKIISKGNIIYKDKLIKL